MHQDSAMAPVTAGIILLLRKVLLKDSPFCGKLVGLCPCWCASMQNARQLFFPQSPLGCQCQLAAQRKLTAVYLPYDF
jgi:hypothetical protein